MLWLRPRRVYDYEHEEHQDRITERIRRLWKNENLRFSLLIAVFIAVCAAGAWFAVLNPGVWKDGFLGSIALWIVFGFAGGATATIIYIKFYPMEKELEEWDNESWGMFFYGFWVYFLAIGFSAVANLTHLILEFSWMTILQTVLCFIFGANSAVAGIWLIMNLRKRQIKKVKPVS